MDESRAEESGGQAERHREARTARDHDTGPLAQGQQRPGEDGPGAGASPVEPGKGQHPLAAASQPGRRHPFARQPGPLDSVERGGDELEQLEVTAERGDEMDAGDCGTSWWSAA